MMSHGICANCSHYQAMTAENEDGLTSGLCRRYPPRPVVLPQINALQQVQMTVQSAFGETISSQSCGEYHRTEPIHFVKNLSVTN